MNLAYIVNEFPLFFHGGPGTCETEIMRQFIAKGHNVPVTLKNAVDAGFSRLATLSVGGRT